MMQKTTRLWAILMASCIATNAWAQWQSTTPGRLGIGLQHKAAQASATAVRGAVAERTAVMITADDATEAVALLRNHGYDALAVGQRLVSASIPVAQLEALLDLPGIRKVEAPRRFRPLLDKARASVQADVVHAGTGFDSPYTGKGVLVGVIDQGFDYAHAGLRANNGVSRAKLAREYTTNNNGLAISYSHTTSNAIISQRHDTHDDTHATHVAGIAAGTRLLRNNADLTPYYGLAYNADLALIASSFADAEILDAVKTIKDMAQRNGQPWVVNMSFGSQFGPHDGSTDYDRSLSSYVGDGGFLVAAMGNEGLDRLHLAHAFTAPDETLYSAIQVMTNDNAEPVEEKTPVTIWMDKGTKYDDLEIRLRLYDTGRGTFVTAADASNFWNTRTEASVDSATNNGKVNLVFAILNKQLFTRTYRDAEVYVPVLEVKAKRAGVGFHAWIEAGYGEWWDADDNSFANGDSKYQVAEGAASSEKVVAVGAYTTKTSWTALNGIADYYTLMGQVDELAKFSCVGPQVDNNLPKPAVVAPGNFVTAPISSTHRTYRKADIEDDTNTIEKITLNGRDNYYGLMQGTSMATPMVTGAIAIWLEAYPTMPYATLMDILQKSSSHDSHTGHDTWNATWGYGKLNVYEGLKLAIQAKKNETTGIYHVANTATPLTFLPEGHRYRLLFGSHEAEAHIALHTTAGALVHSQQLIQVPLGHEVIIDLSTLERGIYILSVKTAEARYTRKVVVD